MGFVILDFFGWFVCIDEREMWKHLEKDNMKL